VINIDWDQLLDKIHTTLDLLDAQLQSEANTRFVELVDLTNLSATVGSLLAAGIIKATDQSYVRNRPHKYPDLLAQTSDLPNVEIKVGLETNSLKGHLAKAGKYLTCRYVLCDDHGIYIPDHRGPKVRIWEIRFGDLDIEDFNISSTEKDSGKTATINRWGMQKLKTLYGDKDRCPYKRKRNLR
jgi:hypothetical protein